MAAAAGAASPADKERYRGHGWFGVRSFVGSFVYVSFRARGEENASGARGGGLNPCGEKGGGG